VTDARTINLVAAALGGEGGGVFTDWVIEVARQENWLSQSTSLAGVAQRTGATIYYLELFPRSEIEGRAPVMSLFPAQGDIDIAIASEVAEAGRMVQRGFVSPDRTVLIHSDHRVFGISEREYPGDGRIDADTVLEIAGRYAKRHIHYDMAAVASEHASVISAVMLGALAGSGELPFARESFEAVIRESGKSVGTNLAAFAASFDRARRGAVEEFQPPATETPFQLPPARSIAGQVLLERVREYPDSCQEALYLGLTKLVDYQDAEYAREFLDRLESVATLDDGALDHDLTRETARYLALWMCYEDIPRVAQLKTRESRGEGIRQEVRAESGQIIYTTEFFRPRVEEIAAMLPKRAGLWVSENTVCRCFLGLFTGGKKLRTDTVLVFMTLRALSVLRRWRRGSLGYQHESNMINRWLGAVAHLAATDTDAARALAHCGGLVKGYGDTRARTTGQLMSILEKLESSVSVSAQQISDLRDAAQIDDNGKTFLDNLEREVA
jgi:indolepyruvate ferredoxin oxidoreductase beta subunit